MGRAIRTHQGIQIGVSVAIGLFAIACTAPPHSLRPHVANDLEQRMGHTLGPRQAAGEVAACEAMFEGVLDIDEAITLALWNNPGYQELLADLQLSRADLIEAGQLANPSLTTAFPVGSKQWELALTVPIDTVLLRPHRVAIAQLENQRVAERLVQDGLDVVRNVRIAYVDALEAHRRLDLVNEGAAVRGELARLAEARLAAGAASELDVSAIRLDALVAREEQVRAARQASLALDRLRFQLGIATGEQPITLEPLPEPPVVRYEARVLVEEASATRPDVRSLEFANHALSRRANLARYDFLNVSAILPDLNSRGDNGFEAGPGLNMNLPVFHQNQGAKARVAGQQEQIQHRLENARNRVALEVRSAYTDYLQARDEVRLCRDGSLPRATAAFESVRKAIQEDGVSLLLVLETSRQFYAAQDRSLQADMRLQRAYAELERGVGRRLTNCEPFVEVTDLESLTEESESIEAIEP